LDEVNATISGRAGITVESRGKRRADKLTTAINLGRTDEALASIAPLTGCGHDFLHGRFTGPIANAEDVARRMIEFCPDMVDQADASMRRRSRPEQIVALARELSTDRAFSFWWD
jgi:hypothetical protein